MATGLENLEIYKLAEELELLVYKITKSFPSDEKYRSVDQLRRSSASVADNIAESYGRYGFADKINKLYIARGEAEETKRGIERAKHKEFISVEVAADSAVEKYVCLIKQINAYINFLRHQSTKKLINQATKQPRNQAFSLILVLLIISSILTATVIVAEIIIRYSQVVKGVELSEKAYFASETAVEEMLYQVLKNYADVLPSGSPYTFKGDLSNTAHYSVSVEVDTENPDDPGVDISNSNPWTFRMAGGESFQLNLDINGANYPTSLNIATGSTASNLIIYQCTTSGTPRMCSSGYEQSFSLSFPYDSPIVKASNYYKIRIDNLGTASESYTLTPPDDVTFLPIGIIVTNSVGTYLKYERILQNNFPKWQKFGK